MSNIEFTAGLLLRRQVRGALDAMKMYGQIQDYREAKSILFSNFYVKGADERAKATFQEWRERTTA